MTPRIEKRYEELIDQVAKKARAKFKGRAGDAGVSVPGAARI